MVALCFTFCETNCFLKWLHCFTIPPVIYEGFSLSTSFPALCLFYFRHPAGCKVPTHSVDVPCPEDSWCWASSVCLLAFSVSSLEEWLLKSFVPFKLACLFIVEFYEFLIQAGYKSLIRYVSCNYFLPSCGLSLHFLDDVLWVTEVLSFDKVQFAYFFLFYLCFWCRI